MIFINVREIRGDLAVLVLVVSQKLVQLKIKNKISSRLIPNYYLSTYD